MNIIQPTSMFDLSHKIGGGGGGGGGGGEWDGRWDFLIDICRLPMPAMV